jgi:CheY-like chemotaxis protein
MIPESRCILVVEDDPDVLLLVTVMLQRTGATVDTAADGADAIELVRTKRYDVVLLDIMLPRANGFEVAEVIRSLQPRPLLIVLSAVAKHFADRFPAGTIVMQKPFDVAVLTRAVMQTPPPAGG